LRLLFLALAYAAAAACFIAARLLDGREVPSFPVRLNLLTISPMFLEMVFWLEPFINGMISPKKVMALQLRRPSEMVG
jgi:hypothetical protein